MVRKSILILSAAAIVGIAAAASASASASESSNKSGKSDPNKVICRTINDTGDKLRKTRACHTDAEWRELRRQSREAVEQIQNRRAYGS